MMIYYHCIRVGSTKLFFAELSSTPVKLKAFKRHNNYVGVVSIIITFADF
jgi:hypothetical protein